MLKTKSINILIDDSYQALWFAQTIDFLKKDSLTDADVLRIIPDVIGEFVVGEITLNQLLIFVTSLESCKKRLKSELRYIVEDLSALHQHQSDNQFIHNILIDVLRKITQE